MTSDRSEAELKALLAAEGRRWLDAIVEETGPLALFDAHTHLGRNDPDGFHQEPAELLAGLDRADGARALTFAMCEPGGYPPANDAVRAAAQASDGRLTWFCRVNPHLDAVTEARRCLDLGARGIKLHPRAERFGMDTPNVKRLVDLADEHEVPILIHAGRGIPALGRDTVVLARSHPRAKLILAHAAVSDLAWLWRLMPSLPNLFIDTAWWDPADLITLFSLVPPGQILWASDSPYGDPAGSAGMQLRFAVAAGLGREAIASIAGGQTARIVAGDTLLDPGPAPGPPGPQDLQMERVCSHLLAAVGRLLAESGDPESVELARLACDLDGEHAAACREILRLLDLYDEYRDVPFGEHVFMGAMQLLIAALTVARTPNVATPS